MSEKYEVFPGSNKQIVKCLLFHFFYALSVLEVV